MDASATVNQLKDEATWCHHNASADLETFAMPSCDDTHVRRKENHFVAGLSAPFESVAVGGKIPQRRAACAFPLRRPCRAALTANLLERTLLSASVRGPASDLISSSWSHSFLLDVCWIGQATSPRICGFYGSAFPGRARSTVFKPDSCNIFFPAVLHKL